MSQLRDILKSQYHASLAMAREAIEECPEELWYDDEPTNAFWQIAYHMLYFTHMYLGQNEAAFKPWAGQQGGVQYPDGIPDLPDPASDLPLMPQPYSKAEVLEYWQFVDDMVGAAVHELDLETEECGFSWDQVSKLEHQILNLRHIQHHAAQMADRLRAARDIGVRWVSAVR